MVTPDDVLQFWLDEVGEKHWYVASDELDQKVLDRFLDAWHQARAGALGHWLTDPKGVLAFLIVTDQFPRNMFRGDGRSFATDRAALATAKSAIDRKWDLTIDTPQRQFFYLPLMHSENLCDQERCVRMMFDRMSDSGDSHLLHARAHREVIRKFGRFPYRNAALGRTSTTPERSYLEAGGYAKTVRKLQTAKAA